ncbi:MAG: aspartate dehydrogenase [Gemmobacter sp.]
MHLGLVGYGNIGAALLGHLRDGAVPARVTVLVRPGRGAAVAADLVPAWQDRAEVVEDPQALIAARPELVVESAGHAAVRDAAVPALAAGIDVVVVSVGALADPALAAALRAAAGAGGARMILPAGAIGGIDLLAALATAGPVEVDYVGTKPPAAWRGTAAGMVLDLDRIDAPATFFTGTAREAALAYPKNANVAATLALAGPGFDATRVRLVADPAAPGNLHAFEVRSETARFSMRIENRPSAGNARTSAATIHSLLREIRNRIGPVAI